jgi:hypothetical protein
VLTKIWTFWDLKPDLSSGSHDLFTAVADSFIAEIFSGLFSLYICPNHGNYVKNIFK